jgi:hypothetical protein
MARRGQLAMHDVQPEQVAELTLIRFDCSVVMTVPPSDS